MFCCGKKKESRRVSKAQVSPNSYQNRSQSVSYIESPDHMRKMMYSKQSPHFGKINITKQSVIYGLDFEEKTKIHCRFCGGKTCKHENWELCSNPAIDGLHSNWVNDNIIASQRLSDRLIVEFDIINQFKKKGVTAIFNLQEPGEHPYCGDGINAKTGFSYTPEILMNGGIQFFNFFWKDLTNPSFERCLNSVQVMDFVIKNGGKVLVHCHAGQGRTALVIGAYLVYSGVASNDIEAITMTKKNRPKCFSKAYNRTFLKFFYDKLTELRCIFPSSQKKQNLKSLLDRQSLLLHGEERRFIKFIPKVINLTLQQIQRLLDQGQKVQFDSIKKALKDSSFDQHSQVNEIRTKINQSLWCGITDIDDLSLLLSVVTNFLNSLEPYTLTKTNIQTIIDNYSKLESYLIGFLTSIADITQSVTAQLDDSNQIDEVYDIMASLVLQGQVEFKDHVSNLLKKLGKQKEQIYKEEDNKEEQDMSPIKQQIIIATDPEMYKEQRRKSQIYDVDGIVSNKVMLKPLMAAGPDDKTGSQLM